MNNLKTVLHQLKSEKIKDRQEGLSSLRTVFGRDSIVLSLDEAGNGSAWLIVFQAVFTCVLNEKAALTKTKKSSSKSASSSAALRRLGDSAAAVRWLAERAVHRLNKKVVKPLLAHLLQTMVHQGELLMPIALDYIKAIRCIVGWTPHLEHLDEDNWLKIVQIGWNIVLGDPIRMNLEEDGDEDRAESQDMDDDDDGLYLDDDLNEDEDEVKPSTSTQSLKRRRGASATRGAFSSKSQGKAKSPSHPLQKSSRHPPSLEQIECTSLLAILLRFSSAPLLSSTSPYLASSILRRLHRFIEIYPTDTSMHHDYILSVSATLSHLSLNKKQDVTKFARGTWDGLVGLWGTKNKRMKEGLVGVLRVLFPFYTTTDDFSSVNGSPSKFDCSNGISKLWRLLDGEAESRWGVDALSLDSLRLEVTSNAWEGEDDEKGAFSKHTFSAGWHFDVGQALAWAILELQADCAEKLFQLSESVHSSIQGSSKSEGKRARLENPITSLLYAIQIQTASNSRAFHVQTLLFFIDRYWPKLHDSLQHDVISTLLQFVSFDDGTIQSWTFLCFAAIAYAESISSHPRDASIWDPIWTHAMRRANVPTVCRAACHTAHVLLTLSYPRYPAKSHAASSQRLLTSHRVLLEIETLAKDLDVQGPSFPYDSVCHFLAGCLRVASQDVRLYKMQLEEKVLGWLMDCWRIGEARHTGTTDRSRMPLYMVKDTLVLLESICGFSKKSDLVCGMVLPECLIVDIIVDERNTKVIRDFLLSAKLPRSRRPTDFRGDAADILKSPARPLIGGAADADPAQPRGRERRVSAFMLKSLEALIADWESIKEVKSHPSAETARQSLDTAIIALSFESLLVLNGIKATRRVVQCGCKLAALVVPLLTDSRWTPEEKTLVLLGLEPLISNGNANENEEKWEAMVLPDKGTGIKKQILQSLLSDMTSTISAVQTSRRDFQRTIWQNADVQEILDTFTTTLRDVLRIVVGQQSIGSGSYHTMDVDDVDGFAPIRTTHSITQAAEAIQQTDSLRATQCIIDNCMTFLAIVPILQSSSGEPTRDKDLAELVLNCSDDKFLLVGPIFFGKVRQRILNISLNVLDGFLDKFDQMLKPYTYSRSEKLQLLTTQFLDSTLHHWKQDAVSSSEVGERIRDLCQWLSDTLRRNQIRSWRTRDCVARFMKRYLAEDAEQTIWSMVSDEEGGDVEPEALPAAILPMLGADRDIRVRFRVAFENAKLFSVARKTGRDPSQLYTEIKKWLTDDIDDYEQMMTRMLSLGNVMIISSAVRRAPYFHLLEAVFYGAHFVHHIEAILNGVSERMGLTSFSELFEAYASQIAFSIRQANKDILSMPAHLLGYHGRRECAEATFRAFTPANIMAGGPSPEAIAHGQRLFTTHCKTIQKSSTDGIQDCFGDIVGYQIVSWSDEELKNPGGPLERLEEQIKARTMLMDDQRGISEHLQSNVDGIVAAILRTLGDQDFTPNGVIIEALRLAGQSEAALKTFVALTRYRSLGDVELHKPNLPIYSTLTILHAFRWLVQLVPDTNMRATTYHVLHQLFADVQHTPLVNEQIRLLNGISLWVAIHQADFKDATLLHTLIQGSTSVLAQSDLARAGQSILDWSFGLYRALGQKDPHFPDILIRIGGIAHDYSNMHDKVAATIGNDLLQWIDDQALQTCRVTVLRSQVGRALPAWPHQPSPELCQIYDDISTEGLSAVLNEANISSNKFRLVRRFRELAAAGAYDIDQFAKTDFWRLKECIPTNEQLQKEDVDAFANLLFLQKGHIHSFGTEQPGSQSLRARHRRGSRKKDSNAISDDSSPQRVIVQSLLTMLDGNTSALVHVAYQTLRFSMSLPSSDMLHLQSWPPEYRMEIEYMQKYPRAPTTRPIRDIGELSSVAFDLEITANFHIWIAEITTLLSDILSAIDPFYAQLTSILRSDVEFAEQVLPVLVHTLLHAELSGTKSPNASARTHLSIYLTAVLKSGTASVSCLRCIVDIVLHLRYFRPSKSRDPLGHEKWLDIDFTLLSKNAVTCGAYTTALLFLELAAEHGGHEPDVVTAEQILFEIYSHIDEPDGFYGIRTTDLRRFLIKRFHHEKQWEKAFRFHGAALEASQKSINDAQGLLNSFHAFGFDHLAIETLQNSHMGVESNTNSGMSYKLGWRTETWDLPNQHQEDSGASLYLALRTVYRERDPLTVDSVIRNALFEETAKLRSLGPENLAEIRQVAQNLMCLNQVTRWRGSGIQRALDTKRIDYSEWSDFIHVDPEFDFSDLESIMATRISLIRSVRQKEQRGQIGTLLAPFARGLIEVEKQCLIRLSAAARDSNQMQIALNSIVRAQGLEDISTFEVSQEFASVLWLQREQKLAVQFLKDLVGRSSRAALSDLTQKANEASLLARLGTWTSEACLEKPTYILTKFFEPATSIADSLLTQSANTTPESDHATVYHQCAMFAEHQYFAIVRSPDTIRWKIYIDRKTQEIKQRCDQIARTQRGSTEFAQLTQAQTKAEAMLVQDQANLQQNSGARDAFLEQAIDMYSRCLAASDTFDDDGAIRLCSLWFANFQDLPLQDKISVALDRVPSRKFAFLAHQLSARLSTSPTGQMFGNQVNLQALVIRMCREHPFHSLYQVYALRSERSSDSVSTNHRKQSVHHESSQVDRASAAGEIFDRLRGDDISRERVRGVELVCDASLQWAKYPIQKDSRFNPKLSKIPFRIPDDLLIRRIRELSVPVITSRTALDSSLRYDDCVCIAHFEKTFETAGGINLPKITICYGSDGRKYKQLFKGEGGDDLRQDAVMEQVFGLVNVVLQRDRQTRKRTLSVRDYKVIPLASQAGILEFVGNTTPLREWLYQAHPRYRPGDLKPHDVFIKLGKMRSECGGQVELLLKFFLQMRSQFEPVMRHYFTEKHKTPISWFAMRLNYTRSVATTSIVGHSLGLGDRHVSNILIDNGSGEVVHIDLGIAFDQGKLLGVPERVPFRMTSDMVDGMGMSGTQGVFQRCAEETLRVLRDRSDVIMTVLEVFKHDPLHSWTASDLKIKRAQGNSDTTYDASRGLGGIGIDMSSGTADEAADRALSSVARKLDKALSVEYTVNELIAEATDPVNLATMYYGWSPHL